MTPGNPPYAASALIVSESGLVLAVSRKHDPNDLGLPGGKLDPNEDFRDAIIREVKEETGFQVNRLLPFFGEYCGTPGVHKIHWCLTFLCEVTGKINTTEQGRVVWIPPQRLIHDEHGKMNSFGIYNEQMFAALKRAGLPVERYRSHVEIPEENLLRVPWDDSTRFGIP